MLNYFSLSFLMKYFSTCILQFSPVPDGNYFLNNFVPIMHTTMTRYVIISRWWKRSIDSHSDIEKIIAYCSTAPNALFLTNAYFYLSNCSALHDFEMSAAVYRCPSHRPPPPLHPNSRHHPRRLPPPLPHQTRLDDVFETVPDRRRRPLPLHLLLFFDSEKRLFIIVDFP